MVAEATVDQQVDLAFGELVQAGRLQHAQANAWVDRAELVERELPQLKPAMYAEGEHRQNTRWSQPCGRGGETVEPGAHLRKEGLGRLSQDQLLVQPLEQPHAQAILKTLDLLADCAGRRGFVQGT